LDDAGAPRFSIRMCGILLSCLSVILTGCARSSVGAAEPAIPPPPSRQAVYDFLEPQLIAPEYFASYQVVKDGAGNDQTHGAGGLLSDRLRQFARGVYARDYLTFDAEISIHIVLREFLNQVLARGDLYRDETGVVVKVPGFIAKDVEVRRLPAAAGRGGHMLSQFTRGRVRALVEVDITGEHSVDDLSLLRRASNEQYSTMMDSPDLSSATSISAKPYRLLLYFGEAILVAGLFIGASTWATVRDRGGRQRLGSRHGKRRGPLGPNERDVSEAARKTLWRHRFGVTLRAVAFGIVYTATFTLNPLARYAAVLSLFLTALMIELVLSKRFSRPQRVGTVITSIFGLVVSGSMLLAAEFFLGGVLILSSFLHGTWAETNQLTDHLKFLFLAAVLLLLLFVDLPYRFARRTWSARVKDVLRSDERQEILLLRTFTDDEIRLRVHRGAHATLIEHLSLQGRDTLEQLLCWTAWRYGPVVAVGEPGRRLAPLGAAREFYADAEWQEAVTRWMESSAFVITIAARSQGIWWEVQRLRELSVLTKVLFLVPPLSDREVDLRLRVVSAAMGLTSLLRGQDPCGRRLIAFRLTEAGSVVKYVADARDDVTYEAAFNAAVAELPQAGNMVRAGHRHERVAPPLESLPFAEAQPTDVRRKRRRARYRRIALISAIIACSVVDREVFFKPVPPAPVPGNVIASQIYASRIGTRSGDGFVAWDARSRRIVVLSASGSVLRASDEVASPWFLAASHSVVFAATYAPYVIHGLAEQGSLLKSSWTTPVNSPPSAIAVSDEGLLVLLPESRKLLVLNPSDGSVRYRIPVGGSADALAVAGDRIFVGIPLDHTVSVVRIHRIPTTTTIRVADAPAGLAVGGSSLFVASVLRGTVERIDINTGRSVGLYSVPYANGIIVAAAGRVILATYGDHHEIVVFNASHEGLTLISVDRSPAEFGYLGVTKGKPFGLLSGAGTITIL
jgi:hypothetical protein